MTASELFVALVVMHALCDYPLQGDFLARGKNHRNPIPGVPWYQCLFAHAVIHAGGVGLLTESYVCAFLELALHAIIDHAKSEGLFGADPHLAFDIDQALHLVCKFAWAVLVVYGKVP